MIPQSPGVRLFAAWLGAFYLVWAVFASVGGHWSAAATNWPVAIAMAAGSFVAGSTPVGGGTVGFPVLVFAFGEPGGLGRDFSLAIQSVGMVSASVLILVTRTRLAWGLLRPVLLLTTVLLPPMLLLAPHAPATAPAVVFAGCWAAFGLTVFSRLEVLRTQTAQDATPERGAVLLVALAGCGAVALVGAGLDLVLFIALVVLFRCDLRVAVPSSVVVMAYGSVLGTATQLSLGRLDPAVLDYWVAAAPVVAIGAPVGVLALRLIPRLQGLRLVAGLCVLQFAWGAHSGGIGAAGIAAALLLALGVCAALVRGIDARARAGVCTDSSAGR